MSAGIPLVRPPRLGKPTRDRHVRVLDVPCPSCKAEPKVGCRKIDGTAPAGRMQHPTRRRMAVRAENAARA